MTAPTVRERRAEPIRYERYIEWASLALTIIGVAFLILGLRFVTTRGMNPLALIPSVIAVVAGAPNIVKQRVAGRR